MRPLGTYELLPLDVTLPVNVEWRGAWLAYDDRGNRATSASRVVAINRLAALQAYPVFFAPMYPREESKPTPSYLPYVAGINSTYIAKEERQ